MGHRDLRPRGRSVRGPAESGGLRRRRKAVRPSGPGACPTGRERADHPRQGCGGTAGQDGRQGVLSRLSGPHGPVRRGEDPRARRRGGPDLRTDRGLPGGLRGHVGARSGVHALLGDAEHRPRCGAGTGSGAASVRADPPRSGASARGAPRPGLPRLTRGRHRNVRKGERLRGEREVPGPPEGDLRLHEHHPGVAPRYLPLRVGPQAGVADAPPPQRSARRRHGVGQLRIGLRQEHHVASRPQPGCRGPVRPARKGAQLPRGRPHAGEHRAGRR